MEGYPICVDVYLLAYINICKCHACPGSNTQIAADWSEQEEEELEEQR